MKLWLRFITKLYGILTKRNFFEFFYCINQTNETTEAKNIKMYTKLQNISLSLTTQMKN